MQCEEVLNRLWEYLDQELGLEEARRVQGHLSICAECYPAYCCDRAFLLLLARQRRAGVAPATLIRSVRTSLELS
jgi:mycothiol system anti-sigma-R factor